MIVSLSLRLWLSMVALLVLSLPTLGQAEMLDCNSDRVTEAAYQKATWIQSPKRMAMGAKVRYDRGIKPNRDFWSPTTIVRPFKISFWSNKTVDIDLTFRDYSFWGTRYTVCLVSVPSSGMPVNFNVDAQFKSINKAALVAARARCKKNGDNGLPVCPCGNNWCFNSTLFTPEPKRSISVPASIVWGEESVETTGSWTLVPQTVSIKKVLNKYRNRDFQAYRSKMKKLYDQLDPELHNEGAFGRTFRWFVMPNWTTVPVLIAQPKQKYAGANALNRFRLEGSLKWKE